MEAKDYSCPVSSSTVQIVKDCPDSEEKWREAAARKNCETYASQCSDPKRLVYHCVINPYVNQTLEVCAYAQNIVHGFCTDYSISGNLIKPNHRTNCTGFMKSPCPKFYRSTEAYKYSECYELTKSSTDITEKPLTSEHEVQGTDVQGSSNFGPEKMQGNFDETNKASKDQQQTTTMSLLSSCRWEGLILIRQYICKNATM